MMYGQKNIKQW